MIVYIATNTLNHKSYIGVTTKSLRERKRTHKIAAKKSNFYFYRAVRKYGMEAFEWEILDDSAISIEDLYEKEKFYIKKLNTSVPTGYNISSGGHGGDNISNHPNRALIVEKIRQATIRYFSNEDNRRKHSLIMKERDIGDKISLGMLNSQKFKEAIKKRDQSGSRAPFFGRHHTKENKQLLRDINLGKKHTSKTLEKLSVLFSGIKNPAAKFFVVKNIVSGEVIKVFMKDGLKKFFSNYNRKNGLQGPKKVSWENLYRKKKHKNFEIILDGFIRDMNED